MKVYSIHLPPGAPISHPAQRRDAIVLREGFCWPAFFFGPFWALANRMWFTAGGLVGLHLLLMAGSALLRPDPVTSGAVLAAVHLIVGFSANDWRRAALAATGWRQAGLAAAADRDAALRRYVDLHPQPDAPSQTASSGPAVMGSL